MRGVGAFQGFTETFTQSMIANRTSSAASPANLTDNGDRLGLGLGLPARRPLGHQPPVVPWGCPIAPRCTWSEFDEYQDLFAEGGDFDMPAVGTIGLAFKPNERLTFALDVQQIWYSDVPAIGNDNELAQRCDLDAAFGPTGTPASSMTQATAWAAPTAPASAGAT